MSAAPWRILAPLVALAGLAVCHEVGGGRRIAAAERDGGVAPADARPVVEARKQATDTGPAPPEARPEPRQIRRLSHVACGELKRRVERELAAAQRCKADGECTFIAFEYAFRPCGDSAKPGALLDRAAADAKAYVSACQPVLRPVKCAHRITPVCMRGRCTLAPPPGN